MGRLVDLTGRRVGNWTVLGVSRKVPNKPFGSKVFWFCRCDCGTTKELLGHYLRSGESKSCGCTTYDRAAVGRRVPGGKADHPTEYAIWNCMKTRCYNPNRNRAKTYRDKGIRVCERWHYFPNFYADMGPRPSPEHTLDRIDNDAGYACGHCRECIANGWTANCRWATIQEQMRNTSRNRRITFNGVTKLLCEWAEETGLGRNVIEARLDKYGWTVEQALTLPRWCRNPAKHGQYGSGHCIVCNAVFVKQSHNQIACGPKCGRKHTLRRMAAQR